MALKGNLRDFSTTQLFNLINLARKTGTLTITTHEGEAHLSFREGKLIYATLNGQHDRLVTMLQRSGKLSEEQSKTVLTQAGDKTDRELGLVLINAGYVTQTDIVQSVRSGIMSNVYRLFTWTDGAFRFESNLLPFADRINIPIDLENVIAEGSRRLKEWEQLQEDLPDLDVALKFAERPNVSMRNVNLTVEEWRVISFINPRNTVRQIAQYNGMSDFQIRKVVHGLLQAGLVELIRPQKATAAAAPPPTAEPAAAQAPVAMRRPDVKRGVILRLIDRIRRL